MLQPSASNRSHPTSFDKFLVTLMSFMASGYFNPIQTGGEGRKVLDSTKRCQTLRVFLKFIWE